MTEIGEQKRLRRLRRSAASIALALQLKTEEADDAIGASAIEVGLELASLQRGGQTCRLARTPIVPWNHHNSSGGRPRSTKPYCRGISRKSRKRSISC